MHVGNKRQKLLVLNLIKSRKHVLIHGKQGIGKTTFIQMLGKHYDVLEFNTSKINPDQLPRLDAIMSRSFENKKRIVFFDEIDSVKSEKINNAIVSFLSQDKVPIVLVANYLDKISKKITSNENVQIVKFERPTADEIQALLERKTSDKVLINKAIKLSGGDVRQALSIINGSEGYDEKKIYSSSKLASLLFSSKNRNSLFEALKEGEEDGKNSLFTILVYLSYNIFRFSNSASSMVNNLEILSMADMMLYKFSKNEYLDAMLAYCITPGEKSLKMNYPVNKNEHKSQG